MRRTRLGKEQEARVGTGVMDDGTGDGLAERSSNADRRAGGSAGETEAPRAHCEVSEHKHRNNTEDHRRHAIQNLYCDQRPPY